VSPADVIGSIYTLLGIDDQAKRLTPPNSEPRDTPTASFNLLKEIV
jgi:hypothetical protein